MKRLSFFFILILSTGPLFAQTPGSAAAVSSEAAAVQPKLPPSVPTPDPTPATQTPPPPPSSTGEIDPLLDPTRPKNCQLNITVEQTIACDTISVKLPVGTYKQVKIVDGPQEKKAIEGTSLKPQAVGLGYIRYQSEVKLKIGETERIGGIDVGIRRRGQSPRSNLVQENDRGGRRNQRLHFYLPTGGTDCRGRSLVFWEYPDTRKAPSLHRGTGLLPKRNGSN